MPGLQEFIHKLEEGEGAAVIKRALAILLLLVVGIIYDLRVAQNFGTEESMDTAQLARNISEGKGFVTDYIRPFDIYLLNKHLNGGVRLEDHPDLHNAPLYPLVLAGLMKVLPFNFDIPQMSSQHFGRHQPEALITFFNQALFLLNGVLLFRLARRLFDSQVGWFAVMAFFGTELLWRFTTSAVGMQLSICLVLLAGWCLVRYDEERSTEVLLEKRLVLFGGAAGLLMGLVFLNHYALGILVLPAALFLLFGVKVRWIPASLCIVVFLLVIAPWIGRNISVSGTPLGAAGYAIHENSGYFGGDTMHRTLDAAYGLQQTSFRGVIRKLVTNSREMLAEGNSAARWLAGIFLVGFLAPFKRAGLNRFRYFVMGSWVLLFVTQALTRTYLSEEVRGVTSENLLVSLAPFIMIYAVALYFMLVEQLVVPFQQIKAGVHGVFLLLLTSGIILQLLPPRNYPVFYPPYHPPILQQISHWAGEKELLISDIPWATAWYGNRQTLLLTAPGEFARGNKTIPSPGKPFYTINDDIKPINGMILSPKFMDSALASEFLTDYNGWGRLVADSLTVREVPKGFPLKSSRSDLLPSHFVLFDWERWRGKKQ